MHVCCSPCLAKTMTGIRIDLPEWRVAKVFFYNPNIHPLLEFRKRRKSFQVYLERDPLSAEIGRNETNLSYGQAGIIDQENDESTLFAGEKYGLADFLSLAIEDGVPVPPPERCRRCYALRFNAVARYAAAQGADAFSTTLLASKEQNHELVKEIGEEAAYTAGIRFLYHDFRGGEPTEKLTRGLYRQQYCGCIFSEAERYRNTSKELHWSERTDRPEDEPS